MRRDRPASKERGAAVVEFAVLLPVLVAIVCGTIDWGYYFFTREIVVNASREGARVGTLQFPGGVDQARTEAANAASGYLANASLDPAAAAIAIGAAASPTCLPNASCVRITYTIPGGSVTGFTGSFVPSTIVAYAQMRIRM